MATDGVQRTGSDNSSYSGSSAGGGGSCFGLSLMGSRVHATAGIYVAALQAGSPAAATKGLAVGQQVVALNGVDLRYATTVVARAALAAVAAGPHDLTLQVRANAPGFARMRAERARHTTAQLEADGRAAGPRTETLARGMLPARRQSLAAAGGILAAATAVATGGVVAPLRPAGVAGAAGPAGGILSAATAVAMPSLPLPG